MDRGPTLITGASGLLGEWLRRTAPAGAYLVAMVHERPIPGMASVRADLRDPACVKVITDVAPSLVIHAAYRRDDSSIVAATRHVVTAAGDLGAPVVYTSSDTVFRGDGRLYDERTDTQPSLDYGRWKAAAERSVLDAAPSNVVVRLPLLVSADPDDSATASIRAAAVDGRPTRWFTDEFRRPAWASEVAAAIWRIIALPAVERGGVWHLAGAQRLSRFEIAQRMVDRLRLTGAVVDGEPQPAGTDRPADLAFSDERARRDVGWEPSPIE